MSFGFDSHSHKDAVARDITLVLPLTATLVHDLVTGHVYGLHQVRRGWQVVDGGTGQSTKGEMTERISGQADANGPLIRMGTEWQTLGRLLEMKSRVCLIIS
ncbi:hypothetical protein WSK_4275 [Novosphingobium sp. Rr 2-17]|uniref:hypothetical protein n=1 Tax=Novosphingobium sp. Rr 2-17 TaxID=555793 RepID=UPI0002697BDE|nr:hypothetical protein [Novosphingobium sp. Rr 2-17]EIZ77136.1 hypothetical protein WSK_4275 [Novosphingobium sp. Rr 2-17]